MYRRKNKGWLKHLDFIILDLLCLQVCFALAYFSRHGFGGNPHKVIYQNMMLVLVLFEFIYAFFLEGYKDILKRGYYVEFVSVVKQVCILELFISFYLIVVKDGDDFSRTVLFLLGIYQLGIGWMTRTLWKLHVKKYQTEEGNVLRKSVRTIVFNPFCSGWGWYICGSFLCVVWPHDADPDARQGGIVPRSR